jgi:hypothetical protein
MAVLSLSGVRLAKLDAVGAGKGSTEKAEQRMRRTIQRVMIG